MNFLSRLKKWALSRGPVWLKKYIIKRAFVKLIEVSQKSECEQVERDFRAVREELGENEFESLRFFVALRGWAVNTNWRGLLVAADDWKNLSWAFEKGLINPLDHATCQKDYSMREIVWLASQSKIDVSFWVSAAEKNSADWRPEWEEIKHSETAKSLGWLKVFFALTHDSREYHHLFPEFQKIFKKLELKQLRTKFCSNGKGVIFREGPSAESYKAFFALGWCSADEIREFQRWVGDYDAWPMKRKTTAPRLDRTWVRPELDGWLERECLLDRIPEARKSLRLDHAL